MVFHPSEKDIDGLFPVVVAPQPRVPGAINFERKTKDTTPSEKYVITSDDVAKGVDVIRHVDVSKLTEEDGEKSIVPYEDDVTMKLRNVMRPQKPEEDFEEFKSKNLRRILKNLNRNVAEDGFCLDVCRSMVASCDNNLSGQMCYPEAAQLYGQLSKWKVSYEVGSRTIKAIKVRYSNKENRLSFVDFVTCMLKFSSFCDAYKQKQIDNDPAFSADEFIQLTMYS
ncbi:hypothetical protein LSH36_271g00006 [Paralvinella palmiformis]|uniref:Uncharacterized protein n=1 Tax=Paralvinella palmiformis TaxID=53620 RepID=A0AAD9JJE1_9ANNE|nr:hypothetical protein LSH36_271g00006 [Paralvinella palmiformis]